jgi:hypothetical protein
MVRACAGTDGKKRRNGLPLERAPERQGVPSAGTAGCSGALGTSLRRLSQDSLVVAACSRFACGKTSRFLFIQSCCIFMKIRWIPASRHVQVAELTRILEEDELFQYPKEDDLIGPVRDQPALPRQRERGCSARRGTARPLRAALTHCASP